MVSLYLSIVTLHLLSILILGLSIITRRRTDGESRPFLSIVVAAHNEYENLKTLVPTLINQEYPQFEIIIVLDRSSDGSTEILETYKEKVVFINVSSTPEGWNPKKYALTKGIQTANGEWIVLTDADCLPFSPRWLKSLAKAIEDRKEILIGVSPSKAANSLISYYAQFEGFMTYLLYLGISISYRPYMAVGRNMAFKKSFWEENKGYEPIKGIQGGDDDLFIQLNSNKRNTGLFFGEKESLVFTNSKNSWSDYWTQKIRHYSVSSKYAKKITIILSTFHFLHFMSIISLLALSPTSFFLPIILFYLFIKLGIYRFVEGKIGAGFNYMLFPIVDIAYAFFTPILGIWSQLKKDIKWKN